jgi:ribosomal protein L4
MAENRPRPLFAGGGKIHGPGYQKTAVLKVKNLARRPLE